jgi:hypothetical protein
MHVDEARQDVPARQIEDGGAGWDAISGRRENGPDMSAFHFDSAINFRDAVDNVDYSDVIEDQ